MKSGDSTRLLETEVSFWMLNNIVYHKPSLPLQNFAMGEFTSPANWGDADPSAESDRFSDIHSFFFSFAHLARAAFRALALLSSGVSFAALIFPPFDPPILPNATA